MRQRVLIYKCDICGKEDLSDKNPDDWFYHMPNNWVKIGSNHLCDSCARQIKKATIKEEPT